MQSLIGFIKNIGLGRLVGVMLVCSLLPMLFLNLDISDRVYKGSRFLSLDKLDLGTTYTAVEVLGVSRKQTETEEEKTRRSLPSGFPELLVEDIFLVQENAFSAKSGTIVINNSIIDNFLRECEAEGMQFYCVNVKEIRSFVNDKAQLFDKSDKSVVVTQNMKGKFSHKKTDLGLDSEALVEDIASLLTHRIRTYEIIVAAGSVDPNGVSDQGNIENLTTIPNRVEITYKEVAGTNGEFASRYIEIDHSQQRMYVWEEGEVIHEWEVSGVLDEYAVFGVFEVGEKSTQAWSSLVDKWMPFWMAYYYDPIQQTWFGLHGLVWWEDSLGVHYESEESIGYKKSGGCIRTTVDNAEVLYNWADRGTPILIHE
jgi:lipoprotein-anchoring transpeptidase ErfK/SrfK